MQPTNLKGRKCQMPPICRQHEAAESRYRISAYSAWMTRCVLTRRHILFRKWRASLSTNIRKATLISSNVSSPIASPSLNPRRSYRCRPNWSTLMTSRTSSRFKLHRMQPISLQRPSRQLRLWSEGQRVFPDLLHCTTYFLSLYQELFAKACWPEFVAIRTTVGENQI